MKALFAALAALSPAPALAHEGVHMHPHVSDPVWLPFLLLGVAGTGAVAYARARRK